LHIQFLRIEYFSMETVATAFALDELIGMTTHLASLNLGYLGICVTILLIFGWLHYIFNIKPLKDKLDSQSKELINLKSEVDQNLSSSKEEVKTDLKKFEVEYTKSVFATVVQKNEKLTSDFETKIAQLETEIIEKFEDTTTQKANDLKELLLSRMKEQIVSLEQEVNVKFEKIHNKDSDIKDDVFKIKKEIVDLQYEYYLNKSQVGAVKMLIEKLDMYIKDGWGVEDILVNIKEYIEERRMPSNYLEDLYEVLKKVPEKYTSIAEEILKLANSKIYTPR